MRQTFLPLRSPSASTNPPSLRKTSFRLRRLLCAAVLAAPALSMASADYPNRPVTLMVPFAAAGGTDVTARLIANQLTQEWGQPVVVENRAGAGGIIGADAVAKARPDGYTLLIGNLGTQSINPELYTKLPYDPDTAFTPISLIAELPIVLLAAPNSAFNSVAEMVAAAKAKPDTYTIANAGIGNSTHLAAELLKKAADIKLLGVPYKGGGQATSDLIAGHVDLQLTSVLESSGHVRNGTIKALAVTSAERTPAMPDVPTLKEAGVSGAESSSWVALLGPRDMPKEIAEKIAATVKKIVDSPKMRENLIAQGATGVGSTPDELDQVIKTDRQRYGDIIRTLGLKAENN